MEMSVGIWQGKQISVYVTASVMKSRPETPQRRLSELAGAWENFFFLERGANLSDSWVPYVTVRRARHQNERRN